MIFLFKKIVSPFFMPVPACLILALVGLIFLWFTRRQKTGKVLLTISTLLLGFSSYGVVSDMLTRPLEEKYPPIRSLENIQDVRWIVVLGGGSAVDPQRPLSSYLSESSMVRLAEGVFLHNRLPGSRLILTGRSGYEGVTPVAEVMADVAETWGVKPEVMIIETKSADTKDHPIYVKEMVGGEPFILVTSASHMPRAMALFQNHGMAPIPAPTHYAGKEKEGGLRPGDFFPSADSLSKMGMAIHEYLGMLWAELRSQI